MSKTYKICVYAICKNESKFVDRWMDSMQEADIIVVTDTGSQDDTVEKLKKRGAIVYTDEIKPWRFDKARNISLEHVPKDVDICVCTDLDEIFESGWREKLEEAWNKSEYNILEPVARNGRYLYNWSLKPDGTPDVQFNYFKVHGREGFKWVCPVHEYIEYEGILPLKTIYIDGMVLNHYPDGSKSRNSYLPLLQMAVDEAPTGERMRYYLGREYMYTSNWNKCIETMTYYLKMPNALWTEERCAAMRWMAKSYYSLNKIEDAYKWYCRAIAECPHMRDPYIEFAKICYELKDWATCYFFANKALLITNKSSSYVNMGYSWDHTPNDLCAISAYYLKKYEESYKHAIEAIRYNPTLERLNNNLKLIENKLNINH